MINTLTPTAPQRVHVLAAAILWSLVGTGLLIAGILWLRAAETGGVIAAAIVGLVVGYAKSRFVLNRSADKIVERIERRGDHRCIFGFLSWGNWVMVIGFMVLGRLLRASPLQLVILGAVYVAVGFALLASSMRLWSHWGRVRGHPGSGLGNRPDHP